MKFPLCLRITVCICLLCVPLNVCSAKAKASSSLSPDDSPPQATAQETQAASTVQMVTIPGPLRSFLRMAGISQKVTPDEVLPLLARNVVLQGYRNNRQTEFLILLIRYVKQARELTELAGPDGVLRATNCEDAKPLIKILGYRERPDCGQKTTSLVTTDADRAFVTIDSGFPLLTLEETLQGGAPFAYPFTASSVPALSNEKDWLSATRQEAEQTKGLLDALLHDRELSQLYWALYNNDAETRANLERLLDLKKLVPYAAVLDLYGSQICIRSGRVLVPGGARAEASWKDLVGASPESPKDFVSQLVMKDKGWLAAYFDALSRANQSQQQHLTQGHRLKRFYEAFRTSRVSADTPTRLAFRPAPSLLLLVTRVQWEANGQPYVPGNIGVWKQIVNEKSDAKISRQWRRRASGWHEPDQLLEAMFAFSRMETEFGPLQAYLFMSELDSRRPADKRLSPDTVLLLADNFSEFSNQYLIFSEFPELDDVSIAKYLSVAGWVGKIPNHTLRGNAMGTFQANVGLWQILARQGEITSDQMNASWQNVLDPFAKIATPTQLFDAGHNSLKALTLAVSGKPNTAQDALIEMLAGPPQIDPEAQRMHADVANRMRAVLDGQRLVSLDTLLALGDGLTEMAKGGSAETRDQLLTLSGELREFEMPRPIFSSGERTEWAAGTYNNRHTELQMRTDLARVLKAPKSNAQFEEARGDLAPFLRDTLVGLNYAYYEPPGAQVLHNNPLFVRSHDFSGDTIIGVERLWQAPRLIGEGSPAGGGAHLIGSLADLPYVLSEVEQDFISPQNVQALIWRQLVPGLLTDATVPRWWNVSRDELHAVALYQRAGEELLTASASNEQLRGKVMDILSDRVTVKRAAVLEQALLENRASEVLPRVAPTDSFYLAAEFRRRFPAEAVSAGPLAQELDGLLRQNPTETSWERLSQDFGTPHPVMAQSYGRDLLNIKPFPALTGHCSRLMGESWESNNLYWARLADEMGYTAVALNRLAPELTRRMIERIFATELEDWPAILRAMHEAGDEFRQGKIALLPATQARTEP